MNQNNDTRYMINSYSYNNATYYNKTNTTKEDSLEVFKMQKVATRKIKRRMRRSYDPQQDRKSDISVSAIPRPDWVNISASVLEYAGTESRLTELEYAKNPDLQLLPVLAG